MTSYFQIPGGKWPLASPAGAHDGNHCKRLQPIKIQHFSPQSRSLSPIHANNYYSSVWSYVMDRLSVDHMINQEIDQTSLCCDAAADIKKRDIVVAIVLSCLVTCFFCFPFGCLGLCLSSKFSSLLQQCVPCSPNFPSCHRELVVFVNLYRMRKWSM